MKITYTARKVNLRDNFKERCEKKLSKFNRIFSEDASVNVVVTLEKNRHDCRRDESSFSQCFD